MPCAGHIRKSGQLLGACLRCTHWDEGALTRLDVPELVRQTGRTSTWDCPPMVIAALPLPRNAGAQPAAS